MDEIICINGKGKTKPVRRYIAEDVKWQRATGFKPQTIEPPSMSELENAGDQEPTKEHQVPLSENPNFHRMNEQPTGDQQKSNDLPTEFVIETPGDQEPEIKKDEVIPPGEGDSSVQFDFTETGMKVSDAEDAKSAGMTEQQTENQQQVNEQQSNRRVSSRARQ